MARSASKQPTEGLIGNLLEKVFDGSAEWRNSREETEAGLGRPLEAGDDRNAPCGEESPNDNGTPFPEGVRVFSSDAVADLDANAICTAPL